MYGIIGMYFLFVVFLHCIFFLMLGATHFIYYINILIATKVDSTYIWTIDQQHTAYNLCRVARGGRELVTFRSQSDAFPLHHTCRQNDLLQLSFVERLLPFLYIHSLHVCVIFNKCIQNVKKFQL